MTRDKSSDSLSFGHFASRLFPADVALFLVDFALGVGELRAQFPVDVAPCGVDSPKACSGSR